MTRRECKRAITELFALFYDTCTVIEAVPDSARPKMPYIVLTYGNTRPEQNAMLSIVDGVVQEIRVVHMTLDAQLISEGTLRSVPGVKSKAIDTTVDDLLQFCTFISGEYASIWLQQHDISIVPEGDTYPIYNSLNGVSTPYRAQQRFTVDFAMTTEDMAAMRQPATEYTQTSSGGSPALAALEAGYAEDAPITFTEE